MHKGVKISQIHTFCFFYGAVLSRKLIEAHVLFKPYGMQNVCKIRMLLTPAGTPRIMYVNKSRPVCANRNQVLLV